MQPRTKYLKSDSEADEWEKDVQQCALEETLRVKDRKKALQPRIFRKAEKSHRHDEAKAQAALEKFSKERTKRGDGAERCLIFRLWLRPTGPYFKR